jgi:Uma2 family endonuclease
MLMVNTAHRWTAGDLDGITDDTRRYEVVDGELFVTPSPSRGHQSVAGHLYTRLFEFARLHNLGPVFFAPADVHVDDRNRVQPDIFVEPRIDGEPATDWRDAPTPVLVVEILSATTQDRDIGAKCELYLRAGIAEYWIVDRTTRSVRVIRSDRRDFVVGDQLEWRPAGISTTLVIDLPELFRVALGD